MTQKEAREAAEVMMAYADGAEIECRVRLTGKEWNRINGPWFNWFTFEYRIKPEPKHRFDPKTLQPFDKVISKFSGYPWKCDIFSHYVERENKSIDCYCASEDYVYDKCIPYNDETKHLVGTTEEAPVCYRYWEE